LPTTDINWNEKLCNFDDVDDMCEEFSKTFLQISSACIPSKTILIWFKVSLRIMGSNKVLVLPLINHILKIKNIHKVNKFVVI
jgi:hypothetical protein